MEISPDGRYALSGGRDSTIRYWDLKNKVCLRTFHCNRQIEALAFSPDGKSFLSAETYVGMKHWDIESGECIRVMNPRRDTYSYVAFSNDGKYGVLGGNVEPAILYNLENGECLNKPLSERIYDKRWTVGGLEKSFCHVGGKLYPNSNYIVVGSNYGDFTRGSLRCWDLISYKEVKSFGRFDYAILDLSVSNDGKYVLSGGSNGEVKFWDFTSGECIRTMSGHKKGVCDVVLSSDNNFAFSGSTDSTFKIWNLANGKCIKTIKPKGGYLSTFSISNDAKHILLATNSNLELWESGIEIAPSYCDKPTSFPNIQFENVKFEDANSNGLIEADERCTLMFEIVNSGKGHACRVKPKITEARIAKSTLQLPKIEEVAEIDPGQRKKFTVVINGTMQQTSAKTILELTAEEKNDFDADTFQIKVSVQAFLPPQLKVVDSKFSSLTGSMQAGVSITLRVVVQNLGKGPAENVQIKLKLPESNPPSVFMSSDALFDVPLLKAGESKVLDFEFVANKRYMESTVPCTLTVTEKHGKYGSVKATSVTMNQKLSSQTLDVAVKEMKPEQFAPVVLNSDVDKNLPISKTQNPDAIAVVVGNQHYQKTKPVDYATNDAASVKNYLVQVLGFREGNILYFTDATLDDFYTVFGRERQKGMLHDRVKPSVSDVFVYYSGHGAPDLGEGSESKSYLVPVGCNPNYVAQGGYSLETFYGNLNRLPAKSITVVLDACFSGEGLIQKASPMVIKPKFPEVQKATVLASSKESQVSNWYVDQQHGLFTYFFLKAIQQKELSDQNRDGKLTMDEIYQFVGSQTEGVPYHSRVLFGGAREQNPMLLGADKQKVLVEFGK